MLFAYLTSLTKSTLLDEELPYLRHDGFIFIGLAATGGFSVLRTAFLVFGTGVQLVRIFELFFGRLPILVGDAVLPERCGKA